MGAIRQTMSLAAVTCGFLLSAAALATVDTNPVGAASSAPVATTTMTFVDTSRTTPAWNGMPGKPSRTLVTTIWYPARGSGSVATAGDGTYPLIVFAHGLGGSPRGTGSC